MPVKLRRLSVCPDIIGYKVFRANVLQATAERRYIATALTNAWYSLPKYTPSILAKASSRALWSRCQRMIVDESDNVYLDREIHYGTQVPWQGFLQARRAQKMVTHESGTVPILRLRQLHRSVVPHHHVASHARSEEHITWYEDAQC
jgi:hypothetical protein